MTPLKVAEVADIPSGTGKVVEAGGKAIAVFNVDGRFYALDNRCTHMGGPLGRGRLTGDVVTCPLHGSRFDVTSGDVVGPPARRPVRTYLVQVREGSIFVDVA